MKIFFLPYDKKNQLLMATLIDKLTDLNLNLDLKNEKKYQESEKKYQLPIDYNGTKYLQFEKEWIVSHPDKFKKRSREKTRELASIDYQNQFTETKK